MHRHAPHLDITGYHHTAENLYHNQRAETHRHRLYFYADHMYTTATGGDLYIGREQAARFVLASHRYHAVGNMSS
jgi:hypothetical protein